MKTKIILVFFLFAFMLTSCEPAFGEAPTRATVSITPHTPTPAEATVSITPLIPTLPEITATPVQIADSLNFSLWTLEYIHAYGGTIWIDGEEMQVGKLVTEIRAHPQKFTQTKEINGIVYSFIVVNGVPLAMRTDAGVWAKVTFAELARLKGLTVTVRRNAYANEAAPQIATSLMVQVGIDPLFSKQFDWTKIVTNWDEVQRDLLEGKIPYQEEIYDQTVTYPTYWNYFDQIAYAKMNGMGADGDGVYEFWYYENYPSIDTLPISEQKKILFFMAAAKVLQFPEIERVDIAGELIAHQLWGPTPKAVERFQQLGGVSFLAELATFLKQVRPDLKLRVTEDLINFNCSCYQNAYSGIYTRQYDAFFKLLQDLQDLQAPVDEVKIEANLWIYTPPDPEFIAETLKKIQSYGYDLSSPDTIVGVGKYPPYTGSVPPVTQTPLPEGVNAFQKQAEIYALVLDAYLDAGAKNFGFGSASWDTDDIFDDSLMPKLAYYAVVKTLYEHLP
jgi:hypothetical protein